MALDVGADTAGAFDGIHTELVDTRATKPDAVIWGHNYGIVVNQDCKRFYDEDKRHLFATSEMIALELWRDQGHKGYFVTDSTIIKRFRPGWVYESTDQEPFEADTIPELAKKLGLEPSTLEKTVSEYNAACNDKPFDLMKLDGKATTGLNVNESNWANAINSPPYYAFAVTAQLTFTYGGLKVNLDSQVLGTHGAPIPGLWATGEMTGLYYNGKKTSQQPRRLVSANDCSLEYPPATSVLRSLTFRRLAGIEIANRLGGARPRHMLEKGQGQAASSGSFLSSGGLPCSFITISLRGVLHEVR